MRIAYIISAYKLPKQLVRLVRRLTVDGSRVYIHVDERTPMQVFQAMCMPLASVPGVTFLARHACHWGDFGHVAATLKGLAAIDALPNGDYPEWVILLTGQDFPLKTPEGIAGFLAAHPGECFIEAKPLHEFPADWLDRVQFWHFRLGPWRLPWPAPLWNNLYNRSFNFNFATGRFARQWNRLVRLSPRRRRLLPPHRIYGGSSYWCLPGEAVRIVMTFVRQNPGFVRFFRHVDVPDEFFFQTILANSSLAPRITGHNLTFIDWETPNPTLPRVFESEDMARLRQQPELFARKFDSSRFPGVLDLLESAHAQAMN